MPLEMTLFTAQTSFKGNGPLHLLEYVEITVLDIERTVIMCNYAEQMAISLITTERIILQ